MRGGWNWQANSDLTQLIEEQVLNDEFCIASPSHAVGMSDPVVLDPCLGREEPGSLLTGTPSLTQAPCSSTPVETCSGAWATGHSLTAQVWSPKHE
jgi:hypothetical protein